jgi:3-hydroxyisobutyrate dehydrogenase
LLFDFCFCHRPQNVIIHGMDNTFANTVVGFIGTGVMGRSMAGHLLSAGYKLHVYNRTKEKAQPLVDRGATWHDSLTFLARQCDVTITIVGFPADVEQVYLSPNGLVASAKPGSVLIDMTTSSPDLAGRIYDAAKARGISSLDAPVSGGDTGARNAALSIMVGGDKDAFDRALPLFGVMGKNIVHQGPAGSGQHTKLANQVALAGNMIAVCEALAYAKAAGLDPQKVLQSISAGAAGSWSLSNLAPRMLAGDFAPGFYVKHFLKDLRIAAEVSRKSGIAMPGLELAESLYEKLVKLGFGEEGTQALYRLYTAPPR